MAGHDRFIADLRPLFERAAQRAAPALCCHPYDLCTELIARELGVIVTDARAARWTRRSTSTSRRRVGRVRERALRHSVEPALRQALRARGLLA